MLSVSFARLAGLILSAVSNFFFLGLASRSLTIREFGTLALVLSAAFLVQNLDFGISASLTTQVSRLGPGQAFSLRPYVKAIVRNGALVSAVTFAVVYVASASQHVATLNVLPVPLVVALALAVATAATATWLNVLIATQQLQRYYLFLLVQPLILIGTGLVCSRVAPGLTAFAAASGIPALAPGLIAATSLRKLRDHRISEQRSVKLASISRVAAPVGMRQVGSLISFTLLPVLVGVSNPVAAAELALPQRVYLAAWSMVGVMYTSNWRDMANADDPLKLRRRVNRLGAIAATLLGVGMALTGPLLSAIVTPQVRANSIPYFLGFAIALALRGAYVGDALLITARVRSWSVGLASFVVGLGFAAALILNADLSALAIVVAFISVTLLDWMTTRVGGRNDVAPTSV